MAVDINNEERKRALEAAMLQIEKQFGKGALFTRLPRL